MATSYQMDKYGMRFSWVNNDYCGIYTADEDLLKFYVYEVNNENANYANIRVGFGLKSDVTFYAYSPYNENNWDKSIKAIPAIYTSQMQSSNGDTDHLATYDYQMAKFTTGDGTATINFSHVGAILHFSWTLASDETLCSLTLASDDGTEPFVTEAAMNLETETVSAVTRSNSITLDLYNIRVAANGTLDAYLLALPVDLSGKTLIATLTTTGGRTITAKLEGTKLSAGKLYPIKIGANDAESTSAAKISKASTTGSSVASITIYSPDFLVDNENVFVTNSISLLGDVNNDGKVDISDVAALVNHCKENTVSAIKTEVGDVNGDSVVDIADADAIVNKLILQK